MKIDLEPGRYILAVSGGVDSMVLLDLLSKEPGVDIVVVHFNHGIRPDAGLDEKLVKKAAKKYGLHLEVGYGRLGAKVSEETARDARYRFLESVAARHGTTGVITAHHQDDMLETALINILRGTGRSGLSAIRSRKVYRPLLDTPKAQILTYAKKNQIKWREDSSNSDTKYLRNDIRSRILGNLSAQKKNELLNNLDKVAKLNEIIDKDIATLSRSHLQNQLDRKIFTMLPATIGEELLVSFLRKNELHDFDKKTVKRLSTAIKTGQPGSIHDVSSSRKLKLTLSSAELI